MGLAPNTYLHKGDILLLEHLDQQRAHRRQLLVFVKLHKQLHKKLLLRSKWPPVKQITGNTSSAFMKTSQDNFT